MKRLFAIISPVIAMVVIGCNAEMDDVSNPNNGQRHRLVVNAVAETDTKVSIEALSGSGSYKISWDAGDCINLVESFYDKEGYWSYEYYYSSALTEADIQDNKAAFSFEMNNNSEATDFTYVAAYPDSNPMFGEWESQEDFTYTEWADYFSYTGEYMEPHLLAGLQFMETQCPTADSYDTYSDLLISKAIKSSQQISGEVSFSMARLGAIVKITLSGLQEYKGQTVTDAYFNIGESYGAYFGLLYDTVLQKYVFDKDSEISCPVTYVEAMPDGLVVKEDGTADLWLRMPAGVISDYFSIYMTLKEEDDEEDEGVLLAKYVDLDKSRRIIEFVDGKMTTFTVSDFLLADVEPVGKISWTIPAEMDGFNATWAAVENASGYEAYIRSWSDTTIPLTPEYNGDGTWSASIESGMMKDNYPIYVRPVPAEGHELKDSEYSTADIPIGVTSEYWFSHTTFSDDCTYIESTDNEYLIEVYSPGKVIFKNLGKVYDSSWTALEAKGDWFMYSTEPMNLHSIELWTKDDSHTCFNVYASSTPGAESQVLTGTVIDTSENDAGSGSYRYNHTHYKYRFTFPENGDYKYYTIKGTQPGTNPPVVMTSQYTYVYYYKMSSDN